MTRAPSVHRIVTLAALLAGLSAAALPLGGCASTPVAIDAPLRPATFAILARHSPETRAAVAANDLVGRVGETRTLAVVAGREAGERRTQRVAESADGTVAIEESTRAGLERSVLRPREDGGYTLLSVDTPGEDSRSAFAEGLEFARPSLAPGEASESASPMRVTLLSSGKERAKGSSTRTQRITGSADIDVCGERLVATVVETVFVASLDAAKARRESEIFVVPGRGIVAERWREKVTVLGIFPKTTEETVVVVPTKGTP
jgi:hypothetical protein